MKLCQRDVVLCAMAKSILTGLALSDWDVQDEVGSRDVIDDCMAHVESQELIAEFWRSTEKGYFVNLDLDRLLYVGSSQIAGATMAERHHLVTDSVSAEIGGVTDTGLHHLHCKFLRLIGAEDLLPLAERVYQANKAIVATL